MKAAADEILGARLGNQHLLTPTLDDPGVLVAHLGAVQSQDYNAAKWGLALRLREATDTLLERSLAAGSILRTHVLRPTWHFVAPADVRWMLMLSAPKIRQSMAAYTRTLGLDDDLFDRGNSLIERALQGGRSLTRPECGDALREGGIQVLDGSQLAHILMRAEIDGVVVSGPPHGRTQTYALLAERAPQAIVLERDEAIAELTWRYFNGHGPAVAQDCSWWSGLTLREVRRGLDMNRTRLESVSFEDREYWFGAETLCSAGSTEIGGLVHLLANFDEYTVAYRARDLYYDPIANFTGNPRFDVPFANVIVAGGRVAGRWKRVAASRIESCWTVSTSPALERGLEGATRRYETWLASRSVGDVDDADGVEPRV
jgi:hypothetical protein